MESKWILRIAATLALSVVLFYLGLMGLALYQSYQPDIINENFEMLPVQYQEVWHMHCWSPDGMTVVNDTVQEIRWPNGLVEWVSYPHYERKHRVSMGMSCVWSVNG